MSQDLVSLDEIRISVRGLVEFLLRHGDIDNRHKAGTDSAMQEGSRIHRKIQKKMGPDYQAEVALKYTQVTEHYTLLVEGRADGIICSQDGVTVDEIKGTYRNLKRMKEPMAEHLAQAKCYAFMYAYENGVWDMSVRMTYCNLESEELKYFYESYTYMELEEWFFVLLKEYHRWAEFQWAWHKKRQESIQPLQFPFPYRQGQRELVIQVYQTITQGKKLFLEAPTGVGKTISTIFPAIKSMGMGRGDKLFYLTAKTITRTVAEEALHILRSNGLAFKGITLTAKEKICFCDNKAECNPVACSFAQGHFDRINEALYDILTSEEGLSRTLIEEYARKHQVCPFEFALDISLFADAVICDYNYLFDPDARLKRFFGDGVTGDYLFLVDESHNLLERGREMYSAQIVKEDVMQLRRELKQTVLAEMSKSHGKWDIEGQLSLDSLFEGATATGGEDASISEDKSHILASGESGNYFDIEAGDDNADFSAESRHLAAANDNLVTVSKTDLGLNDEEEEDSLYEAGKGKNRRGGTSILVKEGYADKLIYQLDKCNKELLAMKRECPDHQIVTSLDTLVTICDRLYGTISDYLEEREEESLPVREKILDMFFTLSHFLDTAELLDNNYVTYSQLGEDGRFMVKLFCVNPRENLKACMLKGRSTILFSATFLPIQYYKKLLGGDPEDYEVYAKSVFDPRKRALFIGNDVTSKYTRRSQEEYEKIAGYISRISHAKRGNYMVFCPSHSFLNQIYTIYLEKYATYDQVCLLQQEIMNEAEREAFLAEFTSDNGDSIIGFCVLGGIFGEGIDLKNDSLIGAIIIGTGLPQVCFERELLKDYFDRNGEDGESGFDIAYRYPGMNKVLQAAGRVIRTAEDVGIVALLDERFFQASYRKMFPLEWGNYCSVNADTVGDRSEEFWMAQLD